MLKRKYLLLEREYNIKGLSFPVKGKIYEKSGNFPYDVKYEWSLSHYGGAKDQAKVYIPSRQIESSIEGAESRMENYIDSFKIVEVKTNDNF